MKQLTLIALAVLWSLPLWAQPEGLEIIPPDEPATEINGGINIDEKMEEVKEPDTDDEFKPPMEKPEPYNPYPLPEGEWIIKDIEFDKGTATLTEDSEDALKDLRRTFEANEDSYFRIIAHVESMGDKKKERVLSYQRAQAVADYLTNNGLMPNQYEVKGEGAKHPRLFNNNRIEIRVLKY